jgi:hypothetical protein
VVLAGRTSTCARPGDPRILWRPENLSSGMRSLPRSLRRRCRRRRGRRSRREPLPDVLVLGERHGPAAFRAPRPFAPDLLAPRRLVRCARAQGPRPCRRPRGPCGHPQRSCAAARGRGGSVAARRSKEGEGMAGSCRHSRCLRGGRAVERDVRGAGSTTDHKISLACPSERQGRISPALRTRNARPGLPVLQGCFRYGSPPWLARPCPTSRSQLAPPYPTLPYLTLPPGPGLPGRAPGPGSPLAWLAPDPTRPYPTLPDLTRPYPTLPDLTLPYPTLPDLT